MDAAYYTRINSAPGEFSATAVSSRRRLAVHGCAFDGNRLASTHGDWRILVRQNLHATRDSLGIPGTSSQRRPFLPCRSGSVDCPSRVQGLKPCSSETGAYCQARKRLPERFFSTVASQVGRNLDAKADSQWLWKGRRVYLFDGSTVSMPDTVENRKEYPLTYNQRPGTAFPVARIGAIISLACGSILNLGICRYAGKGQGEVSLLRQIWDLLRPGDVLLTDRLMTNWTGIWMLKERRVEFVGRLNKANRCADFRRGIRLGKDDHLVRWHKPTSIRSVDRLTYHSLPESFTVREVRFRVEQPGFRTKSVIVVTTLLNPEETTKEDLAAICSRPSHGWWPRRLLHPLAEPEVPHEGR